MTEATDSQDATAFNAGFEAGTAWNARPDDGPPANPFPPETEDAESFTLGLLHARASRAPKKKMQTKLSLEQFGLESTRNRAARRNMIAASPLGLELFRLVMRNKQRIIEFKDGRIVPNKNIISDVPLRDSDIMEWSIVVDHFSRELRACELAERRHERRNDDQLQIIKDLLRADLSGR